MLSVCIYGRERICVFVTATVMHACPQAGHKSSLEMAAMCVFVCLRVSACLPVCTAETIGFNAQQAGVIWLHCSLLFFQESRTWKVVAKTHTKSTNPQFNRVPWQVTRSVNSLHLAAPVIFHMIKILQRRPAIDWTLQMMFITVTFMRTCCHACECRRQRLRLLGCSSPRDTDVLLFTSVCHQV